MIFQTNDTLLKKIGKEIMKFKLNCEEILEADRIYGIMVDMAECAFSICRSRRNRKVLTSILGEENSYVTIISYIHNGQFCYAADYYDVCDFNHTPQINHWIKRHEVQTGQRRNFRM